MQIDPKFEANLLRVIDRLLDNGARQGSCHLIHAAKG